MTSNKVPQSRIEGLIASLDLKQDKSDAKLNTTNKTVVGAINELKAEKANVIDLSYTSSGLLHSISGKNLIVSPGHVRNHQGNEVLRITSSLSQSISTVTDGLRSGLILGDTGSRIDIIDYASLSAEFTSKGRIVPIQSLGDYNKEFAPTGIINSAGEGLSDAVAMFYEGTEKSKTTGFLFDTAKSFGEYVITLGADVEISSARIAFYSLVNTIPKEDNTYDYQLSLVSSSIVSAPAPNTKVSLTTIAPAAFQLIAVSVNTSSARYCRMYEVGVAATYNTYLCKHAQNMIIRLALADDYLEDAGYVNFAKIGNVTIGNGPVACYPQKDIADAYADGDLIQQEPNYSNFYTRKEIDAQLAEKANKANKLKDYGITDAYTKTETHSLLDQKQNVLTAGTNIQIFTDEETEKLTIATTFDETYSKAETDEIFAKKSTTLEEYGITDAYNKTETSALVNAKQNANDDALTTDAKNIVLAINELDASVDELIAADLCVIVSALPEVGDPKKIYLVLNSASTSELDRYYKYMYVDSGWESLGGGSSGGGGAAKADNLTTISNVDESITAIGIKTKNDFLKYDWVGTLAEWEGCRSAGLIPDDWFCYIIDDGMPVVNAEDSKVYTTLEYVNTSIKQAVDPIQSELTSYKASNNSTVDSLLVDTSELELRVTALERAFGETIDQINGEVI